MTLAAKRADGLAIVALLGLSQIVGYGTLYYSFSILAQEAGPGLGSTASILFAGFSVGLFAAGLVSPLVGRMVDRHGAPAVMSVGSVFTSIMLALTGLSPNAWVFMAITLLAQIGGTLVLYDAAFAALVQARGPQARQAITHLTLIAGFSSTLFWPLTTWLHGWLDWRQTFFAFAVANLVICLPIHLWLMRERRRPKPASGAGKGSTWPVQAPLPAARQKRAMLLSTLAFALSGFALSAMLAQMVPMLTALGLGASALFVSTLFGPAQVAMRVTNMVLGAAQHPIWATLLSLALLPVSILLLTLTAPALAGAVSFALLFGFASGLKSIVHGTLPLALFGSKGYAARLGLMSSLRQALAAFAPFLLALATERLGAGLALTMIVGVGLMGLACAVLVAFEVRRSA